MKTSERSNASVSNTSVSNTSAEHAEHAENSADTASFGGAGGNLLHAETTDAVLGAFYTVYRELGSGFLETVYARSMVVELRRRNVRMAAQVPITVAYQGVEVGYFRADLLVNDAVLVELKAVDRLSGIDDQQVLNYLAATKLEVALLLNFGPRPTFKRLVRTNNYSK